MGRVWLILGAVIALFGCSEITQIVVVVDSDLLVPDEIDEVRIEVEGMASGSQTATGRLEGPGAEPLPRFVSLVHRGGPLGPIQVRAVGLRGGVEIVSRSAEVFFEPGRTLGLYLDLWSECVGVVCADGETCARGGCRSVLVGADELGDWTGPTHDAGAPPDGDVAPPDGCVPMSESCNGEDDDCDGRTDEDFDLATDPMHCGACDSPCSAGADATATCADSTCGYECTAGFGDCDGDPANGCELALTSLTDCGGCGVACDLSNATESCSTGTCAIEVCAAGFADCDSDPATGCEASLASASTCGACGAVCGGSTPVCSPDGGGGFSCVSGCPAGLSLCSGSCVDTTTDALHCGGCGSACATPMRTSATCAASTCGFTCDPGFDDCDGIASNGCEVSLRTLTDCGGCGVGCARANAMSSCATGTCTLGACDAGFGDCDGIASNGCEVSLRTLTDCGGCGIGCARANAMSSCATGTCTLGACDAGFGDCDGMASTGCEASLASPSTCGSCGVMCSGSTPVCSPDGGGGFSCISGCGAGLSLCSGSCVDTTTNPLHCGGCAAACPTPASSSATCAASACGFLCDAGFDDCDAVAANGCEVPLSTLTDCGACGVGCALANATSSCATGSCTLVSCDAGFDDCDAVAANGCEVPLSTLTDCGACGVACALANATSSCATGSCALVSCDAGFDDCDGIEATGCEVALNTLADCGACGVACALPNATSSCATGSCTMVSCDAGFADCDGIEATGCEVALNTMIDCGACGVGCALANATSSCATGSCAIVSCDAGFADCDGIEATGCEVALNTLIDCGACGVACALPNATSSCATGSCAIVSCDAGFDDCDGIAANGCEVDVTSSALHCGMCGAPCGATETCVASTCVGGTRVLQVSSGRSHTCGVQASGEVVCWGRGNRGQLGDGTGTPSSTPVTASGLSDATQVSAGGEHTCAVRATGAVACWGRNNRGQIGDGTMMTRNAPVAVLGLTDAIQVSAGRDHSCAVRSGGGVVCWGRNDRGQLGNGTMTNSPVPVPVMGLADAVQVWAGRKHTCAVRATGAVVCWGLNADGQLGDGTTTDRTAPVPVTGLGDAVQVTAGGNHSCAVRTAGAVVCWGRGGDGQLGDGMGADSSTPVAVSGLVDATWVSAGDLQTCARRSTGAVRCWGDMQSGSLGDGGTVQSDDPVDVSGLADAVDVCAGEMHACSAQTGGGVSCWGDNADGQLGDGTTTDRSVPVPVSGLP